MHQQHNAVKPPVRPFVKGYYSDIASTPRIGTAGFALLTVLSNHRIKTNIVWPSQERLSEATGSCRNSIAKNVGILVNEDRIELVYDWKVYKLLFLNRLVYILQNEDCRISVIPRAIQPGL